MAAESGRVCSTCLHRYVCHFLHVVKKANLEVANDPPGVTQFLPHAGAIGSLCLHHRKLEDYDK